MARRRAGRAPTLLAAALVAAVLVVAGACSGDDGGDRSEDGAAPSTTPSATSGSTPATDAPTVTAAPYRSATYDDDASWLCLPGRRGDACDVDLDATLVRADGTTEVQPFRPATDPPVDCFYVYPTISADPPPNSDLSAGPEERTVAALQFARLGSVCRTFAPVYRQVPLAGLAGVGGLGGTATTTVPGAPAPRDVAYADVLDAWRQYLANRNPGPDGRVRPFVLVGHSQGAGHLRRLVAEEIDGDPALRSRLVSALLLGSGVPAPGSPEAFADVPPCTSPEQVGCVVSYASFLTTEPPPADSLFGAPRTGDGRVLCTNPAALGGGPAPLDTYVPAPSGGPAVTTPYVRYQGLVTGACVQDGRFDYLGITSGWSPGDARPQDLGGRITPPWGLHLLDANLPQGDLVALVRSQSRSFR